MKEISVALDRINNLKGNNCNNASGDALKLLADHEVYMILNIENTRKK